MRKNPFIHPWHPLGPNATHTSGLAFHNIDKPSASTTNQMVSALRSTSLNLYPAAAFTGDAGIVTVSTNTVVVSPPRSEDVVGDVVSEAMDGGVVAVAVIGSLLLTVAVTVTPPPEFDVVVVTEVVLVVPVDIDCELGVGSEAVVAA